MIQKELTIREIRLCDNVKMAQIVREVLVEFGIPKVGSAYEDKSLDNLYEAYNNPRSTYFVIENSEGIYGGAGIHPLDYGKKDVCELQKMYFLPKVRGMGFGKKMIQTCLSKAKELGYKQCYLETFPVMKKAIELYKSIGFEKITKPMGNTGHHACNVWMIKDL